jgi:hypothetical protein
MKKAILIMLVLFLGCKKKTEEVSEKPIRNTEEISEKLIKNSQGEIYIAIVKDSNRLIKRKYFNLSKNDVHVLELGLKKAVEEINNDHNKKYGYEYDPNDLIKLNNYKRQYCPYLNSKGEKEVIVNCLCQVFNDKWKTRLGLGDGGGKCFFGGIINLTKRSYYGFYINSPM